METGVREETQISPRGPPGSSIESSLYGNGETRMVGKALDDERDGERHGRYGKNGSTGKNETDQNAELESYFSAAYQLDVELA